MTTPTYRAAKLTQVDSRRLPGKNRFFDGPAAILDVAGPAEQVARLVARWQHHVRVLLTAVGWGDAPIATRLFGGGDGSSSGANLAFAAPLDALYAATEVNEAAFESAKSEVEGGTPLQPGEARFDEAVATLRSKIAAERHPALLALRDACAARRVSCVVDDEVVSIGIGRGSQSFERKALPAPDAVDWSAVHDVPVALVTGTNGKSTTVRVLAAIATAAGCVPGFSTSDWVKVGDEVLDRGDYSGPSGARMVLRDRRVGAAILETARGGMLRRGLALGRVDAAAITNVTTDHLGEFGVASMDDLVEAKVIVRRAVSADGLLVLNAEDPLLVERATRMSEPIGWFSREPTLPHVIEHLARGGEAALVEEGWLVLARGARRERLLPIVDAPNTLRGAARHNVANLLCAALIARRMGFDAHAIAAGMRAFHGTPEENPGRGNVVHFGGVTAIVDFAHNPDGIRVVMEMAAALPVKRRLLVIGQAGDRDDASIREFAAAAAAFHPDRVVIKEMEKYLRGREPGVIPTLLADEFVRCGVGREQLDHAPSELAAVEQALAWAKPGDLLILLAHTDRAKVLARVQELVVADGAPRAD